LTDHLRQLALTRKTIVKFTQDNSVFIILLVLVMAGTIFYKNFLTVLNLSNILRQVSFNGLIAIGMTFVIITGGIDLSVGSIFAFASVFSSYVHVYPVFIMFLITLLFCTMMGLFNGMVVTKLNIAPFIVTLSTMMGYRGICYLLTNGGITRKISNPQFVSISRSYLLGIPVPAIVLLAVLVLAAWILKNTSFGRTVYAVGGNQEAARMMGLPVRRVKTAVYGVSGFLSGLAGMLMASRMASGEPVTGNGYEMNAISAVVLGAALLSGGKGNVVNTIFGALVLGLLNNLMNMQGTMSAQLQNVVMGVLLLIIVITQAGMNRKIVV
jgi:ribose transport system permease protein